MNTSLRTLGDMIRRRRDIPSDVEMARILSENPEMRNIALGEDYDKDQPSLYRITPQGNNVGIQPFRFPQTPGFAGGYLDEQLRQPQPLFGVPSTLDDEARPAPATRPRVLGRPFPTPAPIAEPVGPPMPGTPTTLSDLGLPPPMIEPSPADASRMRASYDLRTGEPHREFYERGQRSPLDEKTAYRDALQRWQPRGKRGLLETLKSAGIGALLGLGSGSQNPLAAAAGGAAAGVAGSLIHPEYRGKLTRNLKLQREGSELDKLIQDDYRRAQSDRMKVATQEAQADLIPDPQNPGRMIRRPKQAEPRYVERADGVYEISTQHPNGRKLGNIPSEARASNAPTHYEPREDGVYAIYRNSEGKLVSEKIEGVPGRPASTADTGIAAEGAESARLNQEAYNSLKSEIDNDKAQLKENERAIREKNAWLKRRSAELLASDEQLRILAMSNVGEARKAAMERAQLEDEQENATKGVPVGNWEELLSNTESLKSSIKDKEGRLAGMDREIREGRAKAARGGRRNTGAPVQPYAGRTMSRANLERYAKDKGMSIEEAQKEVETMGVKIQ